MRGEGDADTTGRVAEPVPPAAEAEVLLPDGRDRLWALDRALSPFRRLLAFSRLSAEVRQSAPRHIEQNASRWLAAALEVADSDERAELTGLLATLQGLDHAPDRGERLDRLFQQLTRFDAVRGLPLRFVESPAAAAQAAPPVARVPNVARPEVRGPAPERRPEGSSPPRRGDITPETRLESLLPSSLCEAVASIGLELVADLSTLVPLGEEVLTPVHGAGRVIPLGRVALSGRVQRRWAVARPNGTLEARAWLQGAGRAALRWVESPPVVRAANVARLPPDARVVVIGTWDGAELLDPEVVSVPGETPSEAADERRVVRLPQFAGTDGPLLRAALHAMAPALSRLREQLPAEIVESQDLVGPGEALVGMLLRRSADGHRRLAFEEAFFLEIGLAWPRFSAVRERGLAHPIQHALLARLAATFNLALSDELSLSFEEVKRDLRRGVPGLRVLSGPTAAAATLALHAALLVAESRGQVLVICPDAVRAEERLTHVESLFREAGLACRALVGDPPRGVRESLRRGELHVVFAGADILGHALEWRRLGLVVVFETAPVGVMTQAALEDTRSGRPDVLVIPGTSISWATAVSAWPTLDVTVLSAPPPPVHLEVVPSSARAAVYARAAARAPRDQVLLTFPLVNGTDALDLRDAMRLVRALEADAFAGKRVALYHGSMPRDERTRVADDVLHHRVDVIVATTRYEEGGPIGRITAVLVEQAQSEDPSRVRQLLAIPRGNASWVALMLAEDATVPAWVATLMLPRAQEAIDGPAPAPLLRWADQDATGWTARRLAHELLADDPGLRRNPELARSVRERWVDWFPAPETGDAADDDEDGGWQCPVPEPLQLAAEKKRRRRRKKKR